jgi:uncharacterized double-CXXCG motif protein
MPESPPVSSALMDTGFCPTGDGVPEVFSLGVGESPYAPWDDYRADVERRLSLPGATCPECGQTWANTGTYRPGATLPREIEALLGDPWAVPLAEFEALRQRLSAWIPGAEGLPPGTELGPLHGLVSGEIPEFVWVDTCLFLVREEVVAELHCRGVGLSAYPSQVTAGRYAGVLFEPELPCVADAILEDRPPTCPRCGRCGVRVPDRLELIGASLVGAGDLFRGRELTTLIFATRRLRDFAVECGWRGLTFTPVPTR